jgi:hypothetical protein
VTVITKAGANVVRSNERLAAPEMPGHQHAHINQDTGLAPVAFRRQRCSPRKDNVARIFRLEPLLGPLNVSMSFKGALVRVNLSLETEIVSQPKQIQ